MNLTIPAPRLLPVTIAAIASLLAMKSVDMVRAAVPAERLNLMMATQAAEKGPVPGATADPPPPGHSITPDQAASAPPAGEPAVPAVSDSEKAVLLELRQRRQELETRDAAIKARESMLAAAEGKLTTRVDELQSLQKRLEGLEAGRKQREDASWQGLVKLYETMKPRDAAVIFNDLAMPTLLQIVDRMKDAKAASILAAMNPDKARDVTAQLAQMRLNAETTADDPPGGSPSSSRASTVAGSAKPPGG
jgi:flagellar motility protein MotE (MotC chaperone)